MAASGRFSERQILKKSDRTIPVLAVTFYGCEWQTHWSANFHVLIIIIIIIIVFKEGKRAEIIINTERKKE